MEHTPVGCGCLSWFLHLSESRMKKYRLCLPSFTGLKDSSDSFYVFCWAAASRLSPDRQSLEAQSRCRTTKRYGHTQLCNCTQREQTPVPQILLSTVQRLWRRWGLERGPGSEMRMHKSNQSFFFQLTSTDQFELWLSGAGADTCLWLFFSGPYVSTPTLFTTLTLLD